MTKRIWVDFNDVYPSNEYPKAETTTLREFGPPDLRTFDDVEAYDHDGNARPAVVLSIRGDIVRLLLDVSAHDLFRSDRLLGDQ